LPTTASPTTTTAAPDTAAVDKLLNDLESFGNLKIDPNWRQMAATDPDGLIAKVQDELNQTYLQYPNGSQKNMMVVDDKLRQRLNDWMAKFSAAVKQTSTSPNPDFQRQQTENQLFANAQGRLTQQLGYTGRSDEQNLMAMLASKGLLNSGLAQRELARLEMSRTSNYNDTLSNLSQAILAGDLTHLNQTDLAQLESALSTKNQEYLMRLQAQLEKDSQPSGWAQIAGAAVPALIGLLSPKAPTQLQQSPAIYGGQNPMNSYPYTDQYGNPVTN
jgi:hypothetical protein